MNNKKTRRKWKAVSEEFKPCLWCENKISRMNKAGYKKTDKDWARTKFCSFSCAAKKKFSKKVLLHQAHKNDTKRCKGCEATIFRTVDGVIATSYSWPKRKYCTLKCAAKNRRHATSKDDEIRVYGFIKKRGEDECWPWGAYRDKNGYGRVFFRGQKSVQSHRAIYIIHHGSIPQGQLIRHTCDNPQCNNIKHLETGTHKDNANDREKRNRSRSAHRDTLKHTKVKTDALLQLQADYRLLPRDKNNKAVKGTVLALAKKYNISRQLALILTAEVRLGETYHARVRKKKENGAKLKHLDL